MASLPKPTFCIDLVGVTFIDDAGQECLTAMHRQGAEFIAADALTTDLVAEITRQSASDIPRSRANDRACSEADAE